MKLVYTLLISLFFISNYSNSTAFAATPLQMISEMDNSEIAQWSELTSHFTTSESSNEQKLVQVFDVAKGKVVLSKDITPDIQATAKQWLSEIKQLAPEVQPDMEAKYIVRIPITPAQTINVGSVSLSIKEMFTFYYDDSSKQPLILLFDENKRPHFFHIDENLTPFIESLNIPN